MFTSKNTHITTLSVQKSSINSFYNIENIDISLIFYYFCMQYKIGAIVQWIE